MSSQQPPEDDHVNNDVYDGLRQRSLKQLAWAIESSVGQFKLILARCNYGSLRDRLISRLQEICQVEIRVLAVQQSRKTLYTAIQEEFGEEIPACVMVVGLESVQNLSVMLTSANQVREEFRKNFAFPLVLWIDDEIYKQLIQLAPDLESWATTRNFEISTQELVDFVTETANSWFSDRLKFSVDVYVKLENELEAAQRYLLNQPDVYNLELQANLESLLGFLKQITNQKDLALQHYHKALELWQQSNNLERQIKILGEIGFCYYLKAFKHQDINHPDWQATWHYVQEDINFISRLRSPDLIANAVVKFGDILRDLQKWEILQSLAEQALVVHQTNNQLRELAKDYGFLAEVALAKRNWVEANQLVQQALKIFAAIPNVESASISGVVSEISARDFKSKDLSLYQFILGRSQYHLGQIQQANLSLETARDVGNPLEDVRLYLDILRFLQQIYFEQKEYLKAYKIKQRRRSIEQQFGLRAFIGAGRLEATKQALVETLRSNSPQGNIAPEIAASGRLLDVERLIERMGRPDYKLIVIHGQSGVGKSSLVNAGLIPALKDKAIGVQDYMPVVMRVYTNWVEELGRLLGKSEEWGVCRDAMNRVFPEWRESELGTSTSELGTSTSELGTSASELGTSTSELGTSTSELGTSTFDIQNTHSLLLSSSSRPSADAMNRVSTKFLITQLRENEQRNLRTVLIFDQFEEFFFVYTEPAQRKQFFEFLGECLNVLSVKVILSLRVDYIHYLLECNDLSSLKIIGNDILSNNVLYKLGNFSPADTKSIIHRLTENTSFHLEPALVEQLVQDLAGELGEVRPIELQVVGAQLQTENITTLAEYRQRGTKDELVKRYLDEVVNDCGVENQQAAEVLLYLLTDEKGTRPLKTRAELERDLLPYFSEIPPTPLKKGGLISSTPFLRGSPQAGGSKTRVEHASEISKLDLVLEIFVQSGLVVLLPENPADRYQLVHDYIAAFIRQQQEPKLKQVMAELQKEREQRKVSDAKLNNFLKRALFGSVAAVLVFAGLAGLSWRSANEANEQKKQADMNEINAINNSSEAFFASGQHPEALIAALKASEKLKRTPSALERSDTRMQTVATLRQAVYLKPNEKKENRAIEVNTLEGHSSPVRSVAYSPNGQQLASASEDYTIKIWEVSSGKLLKTFKGHSRLVFSVAYSPNGQQLASTSEDNTIKIWDVSSGKLLKTLKGRDWGYSVAYSPNGQQLASANYDSTIKIWDVSSGKLLKILKGHTGSVTSVAYSPNGQQLASASFDNTIKIWDVSSTKPLKTLRDHSGYVWSVAYSRNGQQLASASADKTIKIWDVSSTKPLKTLTGHSDRVFSVAYSPNGQQLASASDDKTIKIWDVSGGKLLNSLTGHSGYVFSVAYSPNGQQLASASYDSTIKIWDVSSSKPLKSMTGHSDRVFSVAYSPNGQQLASGNDDKTIKIWDVSSGKLFKSMTGNGHPGYVISVAYSPNGQQLASASNDNTIKIWDVSSGKLLKSMTGNGHSGYVFSVAYSPNGQQLASANDDNTIKIWDVNSGKLLKPLKGHSSYVRSVVYSPNGQQLASASDDNTIKIWDVSSGQLLNSLTGHSYGVNSVAYSPNGQQLASASDDNTIKIWDVSSGQLLKTLTGHSSRVNSVAYSPNGQQLASANDDNTIKIWDVSSGKLLKSLTGHSSRVNSVAYSPNGQQLASASDDKTIILWDLDLDNLLFSGCNLLNDYLIAHPEVLEELQSCQTPSRLAQGATVLVIQGEKLGRNEDINSAVEKFGKAQQWDANLKLYSKVKVQEFVNKRKAKILVDESNSLLQEKKFKEALAAYTEALKLDPKVEIPADSWNRLCWDGSLQKQAVDVLPACDKAVALAPENGNIRDSRGLARALTGDTQGAITDFEAYIAQTQNKDSKAQRQRWVKDLRAGKNPFTDAELKKLQN
ncbi:ribosome assembly protein 4 [Nostoc sp. 'Peltigera membranacea cyanobiont' 213]|uniref:WD40 domain-containing protein n=1 Tax=Nostoc sp. 'Peltigera membranacea cyanobiont' 213 TaxID=2014530 RepID=UPI000B95AF75|nr:ribosome assembly protein 4 [Nostoc sp. 'Peltigera membranacea cyanobiont' 213]OYD90727.1 ribosome assembly protein 4 [Nostoc sp. 'Peltigera membranacea cyanobiont' 213]